MFAPLHLLLQDHGAVTSGGVLLMLLGTAGAVLRSLPQLLWTALTHQVTMTITVKDDDTAFRWVKEWFLEQRFVQRIRRVDLDTTLRGAELALIPAPGTHFFWYDRRPFWVQFDRSDATRGKAQRRIESLTFRTFGRDQRHLRRLIDAIVACHHLKVESLSSLHIYTDGYWSCVEAYAPRLLDSIVLPPGEKERLLADIQTFRAAKLRYRQLGVPYHRGYLLYGPPGTGKTSLVSGVAATFGLSIYALNLTELNDRTLKTAINEVPENSLILFEDIDAMRAGHRRASAPQKADAPPAATPSSPSLAGVTLSGLLNVLDGFHAPENVLFVMTTNDVEALDPALLRPGRIDYKLFLGKATTAQKVELFCRFFPASPRREAEQFAAAHTAQTMAEFQGLLLQREQTQEVFTNA